MISLAILETNFEFTIDRNINCYFTFIKVNNNLIPLQCDTGASFTSISSLALDNINYEKEIVNDIEQKLLQRAKTMSKGNSTMYKNMVKQFSSATGDKIYGFLTDMGEIDIGNTHFTHFYYYFVPRNKTAFALLGNDFLNNCEFSHSLQGNILITKFDEDNYINTHKNALNEAELNQLIENIYIELNRELEM